MVFHALMLLVCAMTVVSVIVFHGWIGLVFALGPSFVFCLAYGLLHR